MKKIASFRIDHTKLLPGLYVSREDRFGDQTITTYDIRMKRPNADCPLATAAAHTIEHLGATFLRSIPGLPVVYFGPMGCRTGFYLILAGEPDILGTLELVKELMEFVLRADTVPGTDKAECGNAADHDLAGAKAEAMLYLAVTLEDIHGEEDARLRYPE